MTTDELYLPPGVIPLERVAPAPLEVAGDGLTLIGRAAPYGVVATVADPPDFVPYREVFERGAFAKAIKIPPQKLRVHLEHPGNWVGRAAELDSTDDGLDVVLRLDATEAGRAAAFKVRDGQAPALSLGFVPGRSRHTYDDDGPIVHRETVKMLHHVALVAEGAYPGAEVTALRSAPRVERRAHELDEWRTWTARARAR